MVITVRAEPTTPVWVPRLEACLGDQVMDVVDVSSPWRRDTTTFRVTTARAARFAVQCSAVATRAERRRIVMERVARAVPSLRTPPVVAWWTTLDAVILVTEWRPGVSGGSMLADPGSARRLASFLGEAAAVIQSVATDGLAIDHAWADADRLAEAARGWLAMGSPAPSRADGRRLDRAIASAAALVASGPVGLAHGDLVPVNVLVDGSTMALIDLEDARVAPAAYDLARARATVRRYHPAAWAAMEGPMLEAAGLRRGTDAMATFDDLAMIQELERRMGTEGR